MTYENKHQAEKYKKKEKKIQVTLLGLGMWLRLVEGLAGMHRAPGFLPQHPSTPT